ncbi:zinc/iron permease [Celeribacter baekdonensis B30]|uniref:Zinc/iron permease n=1 Tax=Celeribacter baekdonensis B30 TaxID=1208323 RepID=K2JHJ2_9RHOB|nr:zinc/iron permease [Celeribacter baekdonensis B30]
MLPALMTVGRIILGAMAIWLLDERVPHQHFIKRLEGPAWDTLRKIWLFEIAITLHNIPEGLAVAPALRSECPAFAVGAMIYVNSDEIIPGPRRHGHQDRRLAGMCLLESLRGTWSLAAVNDRSSSCLVCCFHQQKTGHTGHHDRHTGSDCPDTRADNRDVAPFASGSPRRCRDSFCSSGLDGISGHWNGAGRQLRHDTRRACRL